jgi:hypothetical protein
MIIPINHPQLISRLHIFLKDKSNPLQDIPNTTLPIMPPIIGIHPTPATVSKRISLCNTLLTTIARKVSAKEQKEQ